MYDWEEIVIAAILGVATGGAIASIIFMFIASL